MSHRSATAILLACSVIISAPFAAAAQPFRGQVLRVLCFKDNHAKAVASNIGKFEKQTGAKVVFDMIASHTVAAKTQIDQVGGGSYDLYTVDGPYLPKLSPFFEPVSRWPKSQVFRPSPQLEFVPAAMKSGEFQGVQYGLPINGNVYMYVYRHDLFTNEAEQRAYKAKYHRELRPPRSLQEFRDIAEFFYRPPHLYGFAPFTKKSEGTTVEAYWILQSFGVDVFDHKMTLALDKEKAVKAFQFYRDLMQFAPKGATSWHHAERMRAYSKGKIAQILTWPSFLANLENKQRSLVVGKNRYAIPPKGITGRAAAVTGTWTLALAKSSANKALAAEFAYWWATTDEAKEFVKGGMNPARVDLLQDPQLVNANPSFHSILENFKVGVVRPRFPAYQEVSDIISRHFTNVAAGLQTPTEGVNEMYGQLNQLQQVTK